MAFQPVEKNGKAMKKQYLVLIFSFFLSLIHAQELKFTAVSNKAKAAVDEQIRLTYSLNAMGNAFNQPDLSAFNILMGPQQMYGSQDYGGKVTQTLSFTYIVSGKKPGKYVIQPASMRIGNGLIKSNAIEIEIVQGQKQQPQQSKTAQPNQAKNGSQAQPNNAGNDLFIKATVSKTNTIVGDQILVSYKLYSKYSQLNYELSKAPTFNGFYAEDIALGKATNGQKESYNGQDYLTAEIKKVLLFPQKSGKLEIPPIELSCVVRQRVQSQNIFDQLLGGGYRDVEMNVKSPAVTVNVLSPDAAGKPADFTGAVGKLDYELSLDKNSVKSGEAVNLKLQVSGKGNLKLIEPPVLGLAAELEVYDPQIKDNISVSSAGMTGSRTFEYLIIPRAGGEFLLGPLTFSWFDPNKNNWQSKTIAALKLNVSKGSGDQIGVGRGRNSTAPKQLSEDIRYIKVGETEFSKGEGGLFFLSTPFYLLSALAPLSFVGFLLVRYRSKKRRENIGEYRVKEAGNAAGKRLKIAKDLLSKGEKDAFYEEVYRALYGYLSDKLRLPIADLNRQKISELLGSSKVPDETIIRLLNTLDSCEFARFAPGASAAMSEIYADAEKVIRETENLLKS
jgi:hypothetical protein